MSKTAPRLAPWKSAIWIQRSGGIWSNGRHSWTKKHFCPSRYGVRPRLSSDNCMFYSFTQLGAEGKLSYNLTLFFYLMVKAKNLLLHRKTLVEKNGHFSPLLTSLEIGLKLLGITSLLLYLGHRPLGSFPFMSTNVRMQKSAASAEPYSL